MPSSVRRELDEDWIPSEWVRPWFGAVVDLMKRDGERYRLRFSVKVTLGSIDFDEWPLWRYSA